jgi:short-subunit dehydrogenase
MPNTALITGASAGIGTEFARYHASLGGDLVITARRKTALAALKKELEAAHGIKVHVITADLGSSEGAKTLYDAVKKAGVQIDILINNAGFGEQGLHTDHALSRELGMIDLNVKSLVELTHSFARDMIAQGGGKILNVGSTAGMMPGPLQAVYFATKAFVNSYSQAIDEELRDKGVTCTVLVPGYVETEFAAVAGLEGTSLAKGGATASSVAKVGYDAMLKGKLVAFNELKLNFALNWLIPFAPRRMVLRIVKSLQTK